MAKYLVQISPEVVEAIDSKAAALKRVRSLLRGGYVTCYALQVGPAETPSALVRIQVADVVKVKQVAEVPE